MDDDLKRQALECIVLAQNCLRLAEEIDLPTLQAKLGQVAAMLVEVADELRKTD